VFLEQLEIQGDTGLAGSDGAGMVQMELTVELERLDLMVQMELLNTRK
jgi:hypothetical protein